MYLPLLHRSRSGQVARVSGTLRDNPDTQLLPILFLLPWVFPSAWPELTHTLRAAYSSPWRGSGRQALSFSKGTWHRFPLRSYWPELSLKITPTC